MWPPRSPPTMPSSCSPSSASSASASSSVSFSQMTQVSGDVVSPGPKVALRARNRPSLHSARTTPASTMLRAARGCAVLLVFSLAAAVPLALVARAAAAARRGDALAAPVAELPETVGVSGPHPGRRPQRWKKAGAPDSRCIPRLPSPCSGSRGPEKTDATRRRDRARSSCCWARRPPSSRRSWCGWRARTTCRRWCGPRSRRTTWTWRRCPTASTGATTPTATTTAPRTSTSTSPATAARAGPTAR